MSGHRRDHSPAVRPEEDAVSAVKLSQQLTADIDAWAEAHQLTRADAISRLVELALAASQPHTPDRALGDPRAIEREAIRQIEEMLDPRCRPTNASAVSAA
jgi:crotonobetainyl-CoA:carnitine CoA-transferase CaiB-like acyl-CoA transferase